MPWDLLQSQNEAESEFYLYQDGNHFMIRVNGYELMNSKNRVSEEALAVVAKDLFSQSPRILIGGLGIGFTLHAFARSFPTSEILLIEKFSFIVEWYQTYFRKNFFNENLSAEIKEADIVDYLFQSALPKSFDLIVLDTDNGPEALSSDSNASLYSHEGLKQLRKVVSAQGCVLLWSSFKSEDFERKCLETMWSVSCREVQIHSNNKLKHYVYILQI